MNDLRGLADQVSSVLRDLHVEPTKSPEDTSRDARALGARLRSKRRRGAISVAGVFAVAAATATLTTSGVFSPVRTDQIRNAPNALATLPANQPTCPPSLPSGARPGGLLTGTSARPTLATVCDFDPQTGQLQGDGGQIRPFDIIDFLTFVRSLKPINAANCGTGVAAASIQLMLEDNTARALTFRSTSLCMTVSDGVTSMTASVASLSGPWSNVVDPALPFPSSSGRANQPTGDDAYVTPSPSQPTAADAYSTPPPSATPSP